MLGFRTVTETDLTLSDGRVLHVYDIDTTNGADAALVVFWFHGTPNIGTPPAPLADAATKHRIRWVAYDRPGYGTSTPRPGRTVGSAAEDATAVADALGIDTFAVMGHSGGGPHALATAAHLPDRVLAVVSAAGLAPRDADGLDWWAGMGDAGRGTLGAAIAGRTELERFAEANQDGLPDFSATDWAALEHTWSWFNSVVEPAVANGPAAMIDDELAYVSPWGFDPANITAPVLFLYGDQDRVVPLGHGEWLANRCPGAELRHTPEDGHISILDLGAEAIAWLSKHSRR